MKSKLKENLIAFWVAIVLTWWVIVALNSSWNNLASDILGAKKNVENQADVKFVYDKNEWEIVLNKNVDNVASISLELVYDSSKIKLTKDDFVSNYDFVATKNDAWNWFTIIVQGIGSIKKGDKILKIKGIRKEDFVNINIGHIWLIDNNSKPLTLTLEK